MYMIDKNDVNASAYALSVTTVLILVHPNFAFTHWLDKHTHTTSYTNTHACFPYHFPNAIYITSGAYTRCFIFSMRVGFT